MGKRDESLDLLRQGHSPGQIAQKLGVTINTTLGYLDEMVGKGRLRRSDILLSIPAQRRQNPTDPNDRVVVSRYGNVSQLLGDIYEDVRFIETTLHAHIRQVLVRTYGPEEAGWWRKGVPEPVRKQCQVRREEDEDPVEPYCYTDLLDLRALVDKQWGVIRETLPDKLTSNKKQLMEDLSRLNRVRRLVMHPVRGNLPTEDDFDFLRAIRHDLEELAKG